MDRTEGGKKEVFQATVRGQVGPLGAFFVRSAVWGGVFLSVGLHASFHRLSSFVYIDLALAS
jgi:hypothetical protein